MNEEQIIDKVSIIDQWKVSGDSYTQGELDAIGQLLELYYDNKKELEQEKAKTPETIRKQFEVYQNKVQALEKQHDYDMQMIDEVKGQAVEWANELEREKEKNKELSDKLTEKICKGVEEDILEAYRQQISELEEKNKELEEHQKQYLDGELITAKQGKFFEKMIKENYIRKDKIKEKIEEIEKEIEIEGLSEKDNDLIYTPYGLYRYAQNNLKELLEMD